MVRQDIMKPPGHFLCWGNGKQGQHGHVATGQQITFEEATLTEFNPDYKNTAVKLIECGSSHTVVVTGRWVKSYASNHT